MIRKIVAAVAVAVSSGACASGDDPEAVREMFGEQIGSSRDYALIKFGNPLDHVATVHGFANDFLACLKIAEKLNEDACEETDGANCLNPYSCDALN